MNSSPKNFHQRFILGMVLFVVILTISVIVTRLTPWYASNWDTVIMLIPVFPGIYTGLNLARGVMTLDELQQRIQLEAFSFSLANTAFVALVLGLFQAGSSTTINFVWIIPIMAFFWGFGLWLAQRRYE
jgi:hypothetical protein